MAFIDADEPGNRRAIRVFAAMALVGVAIVVWGQLRRPQLGDDVAVIKTVDDLYTAVRTEDLPKVESCARALSQFRDDGKLPPAGAKRLDGVIEMARGNKWSDAAKDLYLFMRSQRRGW